MSTGSQSPESAAPVQEKQIPKWIGFMVALAIVGSMASGGGIWAYGYFTRPDPKNLVEVGSATRLPTRISSPTVVAQPAFPTIAPGIRQTATTQYQATAGEFTVLINKPANAPDWIVGMRYIRADLLSADDRAAILARNRYPTDPLFAKSSKLEEEQVTKLKALPALSISPPLVVTPEDQQKLKAAWVALIAVKPAKAEDAQKFIAMAQEIGKNSLVSTRTSVAESVKQIQAILTPEQIAPFK